MTKIQAMKRLEKEGLGFTANVIMTGCGKPTTKMRALIQLIDDGFDIRHAPFETCAVLINGTFVYLGRLDDGYEAVRDELLKRVVL